MQCVKSWQHWRDRAEEITLPSCWKFRPSKLGHPALRKIRSAAKALWLSIFLAAAVASAATPALASPIEPGAILVLDGDTIRAWGDVYRLVGFDAPEGGSRAKCEAERTLAARATQRLRQLVAGGGLDLQRVACACRPGTEGTRRCNYGRLCGTLRARGRDVGATLIAEGLARPYVCGRDRCSRREGWC